MSALTEALGYVECRGWMIFPVPPGTKRSYKSARYSGGRLWGMSGDPMQVERDFRRWPDAGVGIPTGEINRIFVLEVDTVEGHGVDGIAALRALEAKHAPLPETLMARSPSGSIHRYFNWPGAKVKNSDGRPIQIAQTSEPLCRVQDGSACVFSGGQTCRVQAWPARLSSLRRDQTGRKPMPTIGHERIPCVREPWRRSRVSQAGKVSAERTNRVVQGGTGGGG